jgi:outer membrane lipoprotein carrier protein
VTTAILSLLALQSFAAADIDLPRVLKGIEDRYNQARTLQVQFQQTYELQRRGRTTESGVLTLRKPGKMRWDYTSPQGKLFLSDGQNIFLYSPNSNRVEKMKAKEADDMRAPLAFLLGKLDFSRDFREYRLRTENGRTWITAIPKSEKMPYTQVEFLYAPDYRIERLKVVGQDQSVMEFAFQQEKINPPLDDKLFRFQMPPGAELVEGTNQDMAR